MIKSTKNKFIKEAKYLQTKKGRDELDKFIIEGEKFINSIPLEYKVEYFLISESFYNKNLINNYKEISNVFILEDDIYKYISDTITPQGIMAIIFKKKYSYSKIKLANSFFVLVENMQDPGNLGSLIRTADAFSVDCLILSKGCVDLYNPKVIRATAGSIFNIPIVENIDIIKILEYFKENSIVTYATHLDGEKNIFEVDFNGNIAIIIGNEGNGISDSTAKLSSELVKIPMSGKAESLNASVASGIFLYEAFRNRKYLV